MGNTPPGNVRELRNTAECAAALGWVEAFANEHPAPAMTGGGDAPTSLEGMFGLLEGPHGAAREEALRVFERAYVQRLFEKHGGDAKKAMEESGLSRSYWWKLMQPVKGGG